MTDSTMACSQSIYPIDSSIALAAAAPQWLASHQQFIRPNTLRNYRNCVRLLTLALGDVLLKDIRIEHIRSYQAERARTAGPNLVNGEVIVLQQILKQAGEWTRLREFYKPQRVSPRGAGHSLTEEEEARLRDVAFSRPKWRLAAHCMSLMLSTTMGFGELRQLRRRDVDLKRQSILVREGAKNFHRNRTIPLNSSAIDSMAWILDRWKKLGGNSEEHYILPHRPRVPQSHWLLDEPMGSISTAFTQIRIASGLRHFRLYDCRVQAITKLLSNPMVSPQVCREIAGHVSQVMTDRYSIQRFDTKKAALDALEDPSARPPEPVPPPTPAAAISNDPMQPAIQAEIARQVALALQQHFPAPKVAPPTPAPERKRAGRTGKRNIEATRPRLVMFPGGAHGGR
jgi:integrase